MKSGEWLSERMVFGILIIFGYFLLVLLVILAPVALALSISDKQVPMVMSAMAPGIAIIKDSLLVIGPLLGVIVNAIWKSDKADKVNADTMASLTDLAGAALAATPSAAAASAPLVDPAAVDPLK